MGLELVPADEPLEMFRRLLADTAVELESATYVEEWWLPSRGRLPVFDVEPLRAYAVEEENRERLARLLASYVRVVSGSVWERSRGRWRRRRYSELNPLDLAESGAFARLGDLCLFRSGVFPESVAHQSLEPRHLGRLAQLLEADPGELARARDPFWEVEWIGAKAYLRAGESGVAGDFRRARRLLNRLTATRLFPIRERWFQGGAPG